MFYCFTGSIQQVFIVWTLFASCAVNTRFTFHQMELTIVDDLLQFLYEAGSFQIVKFL